MRASARAIEARVEAFNSDWRELDRLIREQFWRVAFFRVAEDEINYRRFFNINDLAGLRMEVAPGLRPRSCPHLPPCSRAARSTACRIDHIDGLFDPKAYLDGASGPARRGRSIWSSRRSWRRTRRCAADWPVEGTTGYDYTEPCAWRCSSTRRARPPSRRPIATFAGEDQDFAAVARDGKLRIMENEMASELNALGRARRATRAAKAR